MSTDRTRFRLFLNIPLYYMISSVFANTVINGANKFRKTTNTPKKVYTRIMIYYYNNIILYSPDDDIYDV